MAQIAKFKCPSQLNVKIGVPSQAQPRISDTKRGVIFLREGALCMRVHVGAYRLTRGLPIEDVNEITEAIEGEDALWIINLQTGRVFVSTDMVIEYVKATVTLDGEK